MTSWTSLDYSNSRNNANSRKATYDNDPSRFGSIKEVLDSTFFADTNPLLSMLTRAYRWTATARSAPAKTHRLFTSCHGATA